MAPLSPNCGPRRDGLTPSLIVLHYTAMASAEAAIARLCDPAAEVSAHYVIARDGTLTGLVPEDLRAWHAGAGSWQGLEDVNSRSIGIELDNDGASPFTEPLMATLETLLPQIMARHDIAPEGVIGHSDMAPGRKSDPGPRFDWLRLERQGLARRRGQESGPHDVDWASFRAAAQAAGYTADVSDDALLAAVRLRYRPWATGSLTPEDCIALGHA
jgi:N-acetylmuramoyl-L-alanine amidase